MKQAVILAGGRGTRLQAHLNGLPKSLVNVCGVPLLERQIRHLTKFGIDDIVLLVKHGAKAVEQFIASKPDVGVRITLIEDGEPRGTSGAVLAALDRLAERFVVVYGDTLFNIDLARFLAAHTQSNADATLFLHPNDHPQDSDIVEIDDEGWVRAFRPYPHRGEYFQNLVNAALYIIEKRALLPWSQESVPSDFGKNLLPAMLAAGARIKGYVSFEYIKDLGTLERLARVERDLRHGVVDRASLSMPQKAVFLDRDGTLNVHRGFIRNMADIGLLPGVAASVRRLNELEFRVVIVTNQPVIARGEVTLGTLHKIYAKLETMLASEGAFLDRIYFCPHHPDSGYPGEVRALKIACDCRKPNTGLIERAVVDLNIDRTHSWLVGDSTRDIATAKRAGVRSILVRTGEAGSDRRFDAVPEFVADDLSTAVEIIDSHTETAA